ncbi:hypothetical protein CORMATOL_00982 [Corynebacterium matruchotii ATCC 33806]|uniref:Uncharacterized protein n=1 Tax=Corynebacterium matruchotii ATCC 33806 TaxID=566549 RepID=C0E1X8_9CORY|nr:hypothetical protein CORMATOL_00982 [Corynebacterium matruchotii ATCC 33806]
MFSISRWKNTRTIPMLPEAYTGALPRQVVNRNTDPQKASIYCGGQ